MSSRIFFTSKKIAARYQDINITDPASFFNVKNYLSNLNACLCHDNAGRSIQGVFYGANDNEEKAIISLCKSKV